jgi:hypothetical protein
MRLPEYVSPSSLHKFESDKDEFYLKYLADVRAPRMKQTQPMAAGSAFDAFVKSFLHSKIFGHYGKDDAYHPDKIFEDQVEEHNRDWARKAGPYIFKRYKDSGCLADIMLELGTSVGNPRFEFSIQDFISTNIGDIPLLGKPDIYFTNNQGVRVILDWKVNGFCSKNATSPAKGYVRVRDTWFGSEGKASRNNNVAHPDATVGLFNGIRINQGMYLEECGPAGLEWADQLAIYAWLLGEPVGSENVIVGIDQIVGGGNLYSDPPKLRVANHRTRISHGFQNQLRDRLVYMWGCITDGHFYKNLTLEQSQAKCRQIEDLAVALSKDDPLSRFVNDCCRGD